MNKVKYLLLNGDKFIGIVYNSDVYGRTLVILDSIDARNPVLVYDKEKQEQVKDIEFLEFIHSMLPE